MGLFPFLSFVIKIMYLVAERALDALAKGERFRLSERGSEEFRMVDFSRLKGVVGQQVAYLAALRLRLDKDDYHVLKNVPLPTKGGNVHINLIVASQYGIFMIETVNMQGMIFGGEDRDSWIQEVHKSNQTFPNPLQRIGAHADILRTIIGLDAHKLFPVLSFVGGVRFKTPMPEHVTRMGGYVRYIKSKAMPIMVKSDVARVVQKIEAHVERLLHAQALAEAAAQELAASRICPHCGRAMVVRVAKKGDLAGERFWVCSTYPKCREIFAVT